MAENSDIVEIVGASAEQHRVEPLCWLSDEETDEETLEDFCPDCGRKKLEELNRNNCGEVFRLNGGDIDYTEERDSVSWCSRCGVMLDVSFTDYCSEQEIAYLLDEGFDLSKPEHCWIIDKICSCVDDEFSPEWVKLKRRIVDAAGKVAR